MLVGARRETVARAVGALGVVGGTCAVAVFARVVCSPGDDNPLGALALVAALLSFVPIRGLWATPGRWGFAAWGLLCIPVLVLDALLALCLGR
jgi:hypothetical protein